jgi:hypothetical protein
VARRFHNRASGKISEKADTAGGIAAGVALMSATVLGIPKAAGTRLIVPAAYRPVNQFYLPLPSAN